jgi:hypothetical protein
MLKGKREERQMRARQTKGRKGMEERKKKK